METYKLWLFPIRQSESRMGARTLWLPCRVCTMATMLSVPKHGPVQRSGSSSNKSHGIRRYAISLQACSEREGVFRPCYFTNWDDGFYFDDDSNQLSSRRFVRSRIRSWLCFPGSV